MDQPHRKPIGTSDRTLLLGASLGGLLRLLPVALAAAMVVVLTRRLSLAEHGIWAALGIMDSLAMVTSGIGARLDNDMVAGGCADWRTRRELQRLHNAVERGPAA